MRKDSRRDVSAELRGWGLAGGSWGTHSLWRKRTRKRGHSTDLLPTGELVIFLKMTRASQEEKNKCMLVQIYGIEKSGVDDLSLQSRNRDTSVENTWMDTKGQWKWMNWEMEC